jgi:hypothetical protein
MAAMRGAATPFRPACLDGASLPIDYSFKTYNPVDLEKVKQTDVLRLEGRRRRNKK